MKSIMYFLMQLIIVMGLANVLLLLVPRFIRKGIKKTIKTTCRIITLAFKQVKTLYVDEDKKKVAKRQYTKKSNKQPSNVVEFKRKKSATR